MNVKLTEQKNEPESVPVSKIHLNGFGIITKTRSGLSWKVGDLLYRGIVDHDQVNCITDRTWSPIKGLDGVLVHLIDVKEIIFEYKD